MKQFEYRTEKLPSWTTFDEITASLNELGKQGWEVCASSMINPKQGEYVQFWMKRELEPDTKMFDKDCEPGPDDKGLCELPGHHDTVTRGASELMICGTAARLLRKA